MLIVYLQCDIQMIFVEYYIILRYLFLIDNSDTKKGEKTQDLTSLCNPVKQMNLICLKFLLFYLLWVYPLLLSVSYTCIVMLNSWMFIHHTVKKQINLWKKMFLNNKSYFSVDTKSIYLFVHVLFELVCNLHN